VRETTAESPFTAIAVVALAGFVAGALWAHGAAERDYRR
jgi:ElaB/YqjD/DUF883 family membrane-anchored ribosome-binding protein